MAGRNIGKKYIIAVNRLIRCCFSSFCGVSTYKLQIHSNGSQHNFLGLSERCQDPSSTAEVMFSPKFHFGCDYSVIKTNNLGFETSEEKISLS